MSKIVTFHRKSPAFFFVLVFLLTVPFWLLNTLVKVKGLPDNLPVADAGATFVPLVAAMILVYREGRLAGVKRLLARVFDYSRIPRKLWLLPIILLMPGIYVATYGLMRAAGLPVPSSWKPPSSLPLIFLGFFVAAIGEELGYMGYAIDPLQGRHTALTSSLVIGSLWALWHIPSMIQLGQPPRLLALGLAATVAFRILYVWIYNNTARCMFGVILFHAISNTGRTAFPGGRRAFELGDAGVGYSLVILTSIAVTAIWGAATLTRSHGSATRPPGDAQ
jgi:membrane protease YdiL (CAAX protease family)